MTEGLAEDGLVLVNADERRRARRRDVAACPRRGSRRARLGFVNLVMLGAVAPRSASRRSSAIQDAAVEVLGRKVDETAVRDAVEEGYRCLS